MSPVIRISLYKLIGILFTISFFSVITYNNLTQTIHQLEKEIEIEKKRYQQKIEIANSNCLLNSDKNDATENEAVSSSEQNPTQINQANGAENKVENSSELPIDSSYNIEEGQDHNDFSKIDNASHNPHLALQDRVTGLDFPLPWWESGNCSAGNDPLPVELIKSLRGTCGVRSSTWGPGQKVISFGLFGSYKKYAYGLPDIMKTAKHLFPGWIIRLYSTISNYKEELCPILEQYPNFHLCDIERLPGDHQNLSKIEPMIWRMAPMADELVDVFTSRDLDAWVRIKKMNMICMILSFGIEYCTCALTML